MILLHRPASHSLRVSLLSMLQNPLLYGIYSLPNSRKMPTMRQDGSEHKLKALVLYRFQFCDFIAEPGGMQVLIDQVGPEQIE